MMRHEIDFGEIYQDMTNLDAFSVLFENSEEHQPDDIFRQENAAALQKVRDNFHVDDIQACMMAVILELDECNLKMMAQHFSMSNIQMLKQMGQLKDLVKKGVLYSNKNSFRPSTSFLKAAMENQPFEAPKLDNLSYEEFFRNLARIFRMKKRSGSEFEIEEMYRMVEELLTLNPQLQLVKKLDEYRLDDEEATLLLYTCVNGAYFNYWFVSCNELEDIFSDVPFTFQITMRKLESGESDLIKLNLLEPSNVDGIADFSRIKLTPKAKQELLGDTKLNFMVDDTTYSRDLVSHSSIAQKDLFYNPAEAEDIKTLTSLLQPENFSGIRQRMKEAGLNSSFCVLFYGEPGTGKTETALQLARITGRDIYQINANDFQDKYVGESEKKIKQIFNRYNEMARKLAVEPIFLLNECDAVLGKRREIKNAVDQHDVNISNIILQEMEKVNGIIIATTNLTQNLDDAMDRRFLFKVNFQKPQLEVKTKIWKSMLPELNEEDAAKLAANYDFSPGQIMNCARKHVIQNVLFNSPLDYDHMKSYCENEILERGPIRRRIGF